MNRTGKYILDEEGEPQPCEDVLQWAVWMELNERQVLRDQYGTMTVSTIFLGLDHNYGGGPPVLWETMVFQDHEPIEDITGYVRRRTPIYEHSRRYTSKLDALHGHAEVCARVEQEVNA